MTFSDFRDMVQPHNSSAKEADMIRRMIVAFAHERDANQWLLTEHVRRAVEVVLGKAMPKECVRLHPGVPNLEHAVEVLIVIDGCDLSQHPQAAAHVQMDLLEYVQDELGLGEITSQVVIVEVIGALTDSTDE